MAHLQGDSSLVELLEIRMASNALLPEGCTIVPKVIDARMHGVIDYGHATFFFCMALLCRRKNPRAALAAAFTGGFVLAQSLLTDYPLGAKPVMTFEQHGKLDTAFAASSLLMPKFFGFSDSKAAMVFRMNAVVESLVVALTDWDNERAAEQSRR
jgi:hypothetical protein